MSDYLFDKEGPEDAEIAELEAMLSPLSYKETPAPLPPKKRRALPMMWMAASAVVAIAVAVVMLRPRPPSWTMRVMDGEATVDGRKVSGDVRVAVGAWIETGPSHVEIMIDGIGTAELAPEGRARVETIAPVAGVEMIELARGTLHARIAAPPRRFAVRTRYVMATDLGCDFTMMVDADGRGRLIVTEGKVGLSEAPTNEVEIAAGRACGFDEHGVGTPYRAAAAAGFKEAIERAARDPSAVPHASHYATLEDIPDLRAAAKGRADVAVLINRRVMELTPPVDAPAPPPVKHETAKHKEKTSRVKATTPAKTVAPVKTIAPVKTTTQPQVKPAPDPTRRPTHDSIGDLERSTQ